MKTPRMRALVELVIVVLVVGFGAQASAQDTPSVSVDPASVEAPGAVEFTITGSGWSGVDNGVVFVYSCVVPESGDPGDITIPCDAVEDLVDNGANVSEDGSFENVLTFTVPAEGLCVAVGDLGGQQVAATCISAGTEAPAEEELAQTGVSSDRLAVMALTVLAGGAMVFTASRRSGVTH